MTNDYLEQYKLAWSTAGRILDDKTIFHWTMGNKPTRASIANVIYYDLLSRSRMQSVKQMMIVEAQVQEEQVVVDGKN